MDYAKLAYLKAEDLSKRLDQLERKADLGLRSIKLGASPSASIADSYLSPSLVFTSGNVGTITMLLKMRFNHSAPRSFRVYALLNDVECHTEQVSLGAGQADYFALILAASGKGINNYLRLGVEGTGNLGVLESYDVVVWGDSLKVSEPDIRLVLLDDPAKKRAAVILGGYLVMWESAGHSINFTAQPKVICEAADFGMSPYLDGEEMLFAVIDEQKNLDLMTESGAKIARIDTDADSAALYSADGQNFTVAYIKNGKIFVAEADFTGRILHTLLAPPVSQPERVCAVADCDRPMFLIKTASGKIYLFCAYKTAQSFSNILIPDVGIEFSQLAP